MKIKNDCAFAQWSRPTTCKRLKLAFTAFSMRRLRSQRQNKVLHKIRNRGYNIVNIPVSVMHVFMYKVSNSMFLRERESPLYHVIITHTQHIKSLHFEYIHYSYYTAVKNFAILYTVFTKLFFISTIFPLYNI